MVITVIATAQATLVLARLTTRVAAIQTRTVRSTRALAIRMARMDRAPRPTARNIRIHAEAIKKIKEKYGRNIENIIVDSYWRMSNP